MASTCSSSRRRRRAPAASDDEIDAHVTAALAEGLSTRDAAARVARDLKVPRRRAYDAAMRLKPKRAQ